MPKLLNMNVGDTMPISVNEGVELLVEGTIDGAAKLVPEDYKPYVEMLKPAVEPVFNIIHMLIPYVFMIGSLLKDLWEKAQPYHVSINIYRYTKILQT